MASSVPFTLKAASGYLSLAAASAGATPKRMPPKPASATTAAPFRISRRVSSARPGIEWVMQILLEARPWSQRLQEVDDRVDFFVGENVIAPERWHHRQRIALGFVGDDRNQIGEVRVFGLDVGQGRSDVACEVAALDLMAGQAIALAAIE